MMDNALVCDLLFQFHDPHQKDIIVSLIFTTRHALYESIWIMWNQWCESRWIKTGVIH